MEVSPQKCFSFFFPPVLPGSVAINKQTNNEESLQFILWVGLVFLAAVMLFFYFQDWLYWYLTWSPGESIGVTVRSGFSSSEMNKTWTKAVMSRFTLFRLGGKCWLLHWQNLWLSRWIQNYSFPLWTENVQFEDFTTDNKFGIIYLFIVFSKKN